MDTLPYDAEPIAVSFRDSAVAEVPQEESCVEMTQRDPVVAVEAHEASVPVKEVVPGDADKTLAAEDMAEPQADKTLPAEDMAEPAVPSVLDFKAEAPSSQQFVCAHA